MGKNLSCQIGIAGEFKVAKIKMFYGEIVVVKDSHTFASTKYSFDCVIIIYHAKCLRPYDAQSSNI